MPLPSEVYRQKAAECEQRAERATGTLAKKTFRNAAKQWLSLAALVEGQGLVIE
jgi:hypothetical protein